MKELDTFSELVDVRKPHMNDQKPKPEPESQRQQLTELNNRSRWYASQLWQIPFAYLGLTGLTIASAAEKMSSQMPIVFLTCAVFGVCVLVHTFGIMDGVKRAVKNLQKIENDLHLEETAKYKVATYELPLLLAVALAVVLYSIAIFKPWPLTNRADSERPPAQSTTHTG